MPSSLSSGALVHFLRIGKGAKNSAGKLTIQAGSTLQNDGTLTNTGAAVYTGTLVIPVGTKPATCTVGQLMADSADSNKLYQCTATNTWTKVGTQA